LDGKESTKRLANISIKCQEAATPLLRKIIMKNFLFAKSSMVRADVFRQVLWQFLSVRLRRLSDFLRGAFLAAFGGENRSNYFKNTAHFRKRQARGSRLASLGGQFVLNFGRKNQLAIPFLRKENFSNNY